MPCHKNQITPQQQKISSHIANCSKRKTSPQRFLQRSWHPRPSLKMRKSNLMMWKTGSEVNILVMSDTKYHFIFKITACQSPKKLLKEILKDKKIIACIWTMTPNNNIFHGLISAIKSSVPMQLKVVINLFTVKDSIFYNIKHIEVPNNRRIQVTPKSWTDVFTVRGP